jgi:sphingomyelin phosphodiesterase 2
MGIRVATFNVWALPPLADRVSERMEAIGAHLADLDVDVIAFQEVWGTDARNTLLAAGRRAGLVNAWYNDSSFGGGGLLVLSRLPVTSSRFDRFALNGYPQRLDHPDYYGGKGFARIELETPDGLLTFINTHLHARYSKDVDHEYRHHRVGQIVQLALACLENQSPIVAVGDFNFGEGEPEYAVLAGLTGMRDVAAELDRRQPTIWRGNTYRSRRRKPDRRIDYVFARNGAASDLSPRRAQRIFDETFRLGGLPTSYSNHAGVLAEIDVVPRRGAASASPRPDALRLASQLLAEGRAEAERRQRDGRALASTGLAGATLASLGIRTQRLSRRRLLRVGLQGAALLALTPGVGFSILSEIVAPDELRAFDSLAAHLSRIGRTRSNSLIA